MIYPYPFGVVRHPGQVAATYSVGNALVRRTCRSVLHCSEKLTRIHVHVQLPFSKQRAQFIYITRRPYLFRSACYVAYPNTIIVCRQSNSRNWYQTPVAEATANPYSLGIVLRESKPPVSRLQRKIVTNIRLNMQRDNSSFAQVAAFSNFLTTCMIRV